MKHYHLAFNCYTEFKTQISGRRSGPDLEICLQQRLLHGVPWTSSTRQNRSGASSRLRTWKPKHLNRRKCGGCEQFALFGVYHRTWTLRSPSYRRQISLCQALAEINTSLFDHQRHSFLQISNTKFEQICGNLKMLLVFIITLCCCCCCCCCCCRC